MDTAGIAARGIEPLRPVLETIAASQGGLGLPDREYYLKTNGRSEQLRRQYVEQVLKTLELSGESQSRAVRARADRL